MPRPRTVALLSLLAVVAALVPPTAPVLAAAETGPSVASAPLHRVVWTTAVNRGLHVRSARLDGSDVRKVYDSPRGSAIRLSLDPEGRRVAFTSCCDDPSLLTVAPVLGGEPIEPLADHPEIDQVVGIGWSPDGTRLAFEGVQQRHGKRLVSLFTVGVDGSDLTRVVRVSSSDFYQFNDYLAWTADGILYSDGRDLRVATEGETRVVLRKTLGVRLSGDGSTLVLVRQMSRAEYGSESVWTSGPDARRPQQVMPGDQVGHYYWYDPSSFLATDGGRVLTAYRSHFPDEYEEGRSIQQTVTWKIARGVRSARVIKVTGESKTATRG